MDKLSGRNESEHLVSVNAGGVILGRTGTEGQRSDSVPRFLFLHLGRRSGAMGASRTGFETD